jgi:hypothetical protein
MDHKAIQPDDEITKKSFLAQLLFRRLDEATAGALLLDVALGSLANACDLLVNRRAIPCDVDVELSLLALTPALVLQ